MKEAMKRFQTSEDPRELILHMQKPLEFEQKVFREAFEAKLNEYVRNAKSRFKDEMKEVIEVIKDLFKKWKEIFHQKEEEGVTPEHKKDILK